MQNSRVLRPSHELSLQPKKSAKFHSVSTYDTEELFTDCFHDWTCLNCSEIQLMMERQVSFKVIINKCPWPPKNINQNCRIWRPSRTGCNKSEHQKQKLVLKIRKYTNQQGRPQSPEKWVKARVP